ncbi:hypothetical protein LZ32DRAFT_540260 [Colletotrichum eremochloae]|nr:hypothetical protein LZ32DRAFT_540260 [Colletotrichum eremochloae]
MAEVFGVVVSALTVADMASKLGASIFKLSRLWEEVKDAPEDISERIMQLAIMKPVLEETEARLRNDDDGQHGIRHSSTADASVEYCRQAVNKLDLLAKDLQERISKAKTTRGKLKAQFQVPLKKDVLQRYDKQIKFALEMLALSQQTYIM